MVHRLFIGPFSFSQTGSPQTWFHSQVPGLPLTRGHRRCPGAARGDGDSCIQLLIGVAQEGVWRLAVGLALSTSLGCESGPVIPRGGQIWGTGGDSVGGGRCLGSMHVGQGAQPELLDLAEGAACYEITEPHASRIKLSKRISHPTNVPFQGTLDSGPTNESVTRGSLRQASSSPLGVGGESRCKNSQNWHCEAFTLAQSPRPPPELRSRWVSESPKGVLAALVRTVPKSRRSQPVLDGPTAAFCTAPAQVCTEGTDVWRSPWRAHEGTANYGRAGVWRTSLPSRSL